MRTTLLKFHKKNKKHGFTLIEIIAAVGIFAILTAIAVPSVGGYMVSSEMMELNQTAKTLFLCAQDYLSQAAASGRLEEINAEAELVDLGLILPVVGSDERTQNANNISFLTLSRVGPHDGILRSILDPFVGDKSILDQSILVEYNKNTGVVRSVFYSKRADTLNYRGAVTDQTDVKSRNEAQLRQKRQGYYGVDYTGELGKRQRLPAPTVELVNNDRLTAEWTDVTPSGALNMTYTLTIKSADMNTDYLRIEGIPNITNSAVPISVLNSEYKALNNPQIICPVTYPASAGNMPISISRDQTNKKIIVILDDIHQSIYDKFPQIPLGNICVTVEPIVSWILPTTGISNSTNSYFGANTTGSGAGVVYDIAYARHLDNIRHAPETSKFKQSAIIDWSKPEADNTTAATPFETINFCYRDASGTVIMKDAFQGVYDGGSSIENRIYIKNLMFAVGANLTRSYLPSGYDFTMNYGLFHKMNSATIKNAEIWNPYLDLASYERVGAFAGTATGSHFIDCVADNTLDGSFSAIVNGKSQVGGLVGYAEKTEFSNVKNAALVTGTGDDVGGLVGYLKSGKIETGINMNTVKGVNFVGGIVGQNAAGTTILNPVTSVSYSEGFDKDIIFSNILEQMTALDGLPTGATGVYGSGEKVGGVSGQNDGTLTINAVSGTAVQEIVVAKGSYAGGLVGYNKGTMDLLNLSTVTGKQHTDGVVVSGDSYAGGILGGNDGTIKLTGLITSSHVATKEYAGGIIGTNGTKDKKGADITSCTANGMVYAMTQYAGGIAGENYGTINTCSSASANAAALDATLTAKNLPYGDFVGGITGYNNGSIISCKSGNLVKGKNYVGGITGKNDTNGKLETCSTTGGRVVASGNFAGGLIGLNESNVQNLDGKIMGSLNSQAELVQGKYYVGGVIGCNTTVSGSLVILSESGDSKQINKCAVVGDAYVGGIIGYNGALSEADRLSPDPFKELITEEPDEPGEPDKPAEPNSTTQMTYCKNFASVSGVRYVGGMIGLNGIDSKLKIDNSQNDGAISYRSSDTLKPPNNASGWDECYYIGGITGRNTAYGTIDTSRNNGKISNVSKYTGGLVELNEGYITNCTNAGEVTSSRSHVGGIAGANTSSSSASEKIAFIEKCLASNGSKVYGNSYVGGIVGDNNARIQDCTFDGGSTGRVQATGDDTRGSSDQFKGNFVGGIAGYNSETGRISSSDAEKADTTTKSLSGLVKGGYMVGGIVGYSEGRTAEKADSSETTKNTDLADDPNEIRDFSNGATVYGQYFVGGIVGYHNSTTLTIENCINAKSGTVVSTGGVTGKGTGQTSTAEYSVALPDKGLTVQLADSGAGGIVSYNPSGVTVSESYNRGTVFGGASDGALAKSGGITALNKGTIDSCTNSGKVWSTLKAYDYNATGLQSDADNAGGIAGISTGTVKNCTAKVETDNKKPSVAAQIGGRKNVGGLVGQLQTDAVLDACTMNDSGYLVSGGGYVGGLAGYWQGGTISNITTVSAKVEGKNVGTGWVTAAVPRAVGGVIGFSDQQINGFTFAGTVSGFLGSKENYQQMGGIVGNNTNGVKNCIVTGSVTNNSEDTSNGNLSGVGGIAGYSTAALENCKLSATTTVTGAAHVGGLVGYNATNGTISKECSNEGATVETKSTTAGGFIGYNTSWDALLRGTEENKLVNHATVKGPTSVGGIVGETQGEISWCENAGAVSCGLKNAGGIAGTVTQIKSDVPTRIMNCVNTATGYVSGSGNATSIGGILGSNSSSLKASVAIEKCDNMGIVEAVKDSACTYIGGIAGTLNTGSSSAQASVKDSTNTGIVKYSGKGKIMDTNNPNTCNLQMSMGGIVGLMQGAVAENCQNKGQILIADTNGRKVERVGGIVGETGGSTANKLTKCSNEYEIAFDTTVIATKLGGLAGYVNGTNFTLQDCKNNAKVTVPFGGDVGGLVGYLMAKTAEIKDSSNEKPVESNTVAGGIVGTVYRYAFGTNNCPVITNCNNNAEIAARIAGGILGLRDSNEVTIKVDSCNNYAKILEKGDPNGSAGGIVGSLGFNNNKMNAQNEILNCNNSAAIISNGPGYAMGGIVGTISDTGGQLIALIQKCVNSGPVGEQGIRDIGGIVGSGSAKKMTVLECQNNGTVQAEDTAVNVGGAVGYNGGSVVSSSNMASVTGGSLVGGLVGNNANRYALVYTDTIKSADYSSNTGAVTAKTGHAGGIAGANYGGGVVGTYNTGNVSATNAAGGLIGYATNSGDVVGSLANSYSVAQIVNGNESGGVVGHREAAYDSVGSHNIKQGLYHNYNPLSLAVGNEPSPAAGANLIKVKNDEPPVNNGNAHNKELLEADFKRLKILGDGDTIDWDDPDEVVSLLQARIQRQGYQPPQPRDTVTISDHGYWYNTSWEMVQGVITDYAVYLRPTNGNADGSQDIYVGKANEGGTDPSGRLKTNLPFDIKKVYENNQAKFVAQGIDSFEKLIGMKYDVVVVTIGQKVPDIDDPNDPAKAKNLESDCAVSEEDRKFLPPLPAPVLEAPEVGEDRIYTIPITKSTYADKGPTVVEYPNLLSDPATQDIYKEEYVEGLAASAFKAEDRATSGNKGEIIGPNISPADASYKFQVDHRKENVKTEHLIYAQALSKDTINGYANSEWSEPPAKYYVQVRLPAPTGLKSTFNGDVTRVNYKLEWGKVDNNSGYEVTIQYNVKAADGTPSVETKIVKIPKDTTFYDWGDADSIIFAEDPKAKFSVKTLGDDSIPLDRIFYLTSFPSVSKDILLPVKLNPPVFTNMDSTVDESGASCTVNWTHDRKDLIKNYVMEVFRYQVGVEASTKVPYPTTGNSYTISAGDVQKDFTFKDGNYEFGYTYVFKMTAVGISGASLTSDTVETSYTLYERLPIPDKVEVDISSRKPDIVVTWPEKQKSGDPYPTPYGTFQLEFKNPLDPQEVVTALFVPGGDGIYRAVDPVEELGLGLKPGTAYQVTLQALGTANKSPSLKSENSAFTLLDRIPKVNNLKLTIQRADDVLSLSEFGTVKHQVAWDTYADQIKLFNPYYNIKAYTGTADAPLDITEQVKIYYNDHSEAGGFGRESKSFAFSAPAIYAGEPIWFTVEAVAGNAALNSEIASTEQYRLPKAKLPTLLPENESYPVLTVTDATGNIEIPVNDALASTLAAYAEQGRLEDYQMNFTVEYMVDNRYPRSANLAAHVKLENFIVKKGETPGIVLLSIDPRCLPTNLSRSERHKLEKEAEEREEARASSEEVSSSEAVSVETSSEPQQSSAAEESSGAAEVPPELSASVQTAAANQTIVLTLAAHDGPEESLIPDSAAASGSLGDDSSSSEASSSSLDSEETAASAEASSSSAPSEDTSASSEAVSSSPQSGPEPASSPAERAHVQYSNRAVLLDGSYDPSYQFNDDTTERIEITSAFRPFRLAFKVADGSILRVVSVKNLQIAIKAKDNCGLVSSDGYGADGKIDAPLVDSGVYDSGYLDSGLDSGAVGARSARGKTDNRIEIAHVPFEIIYEDGGEPVSSEEEEESSSEEDSYDDADTALTERPTAEPMEESAASSRAALDISSSLDSKQSASRSVRRKNAVSTGKYEDLHQTPG